MPIRINEQIHPAVPIRYFPNDHPAGVPLFQWKAHANLLFANWLNYEVYQITPYHLNDVGKKAGSCVEVSPSPMERWFGSG